MKTIWKYNVPIEGEFEIEMPEGAKVLSVQVQPATSFLEEIFSGAMLWCLVDDAAPKTEKRFRLFGTGHPVEQDESLAFVGTFQLRGGELVFHLFEEAES